MSATIARLLEYSDERRLEDYLALFTEDATFTIGEADRQEGLAAIRAATRARWAAAPPGQARHLVSGMTVQVEGDLARSTACVTLLVHRDGAPAIAGTALYEDTLVRRPRGWRFRTHQIRVDA